MIGPTGQKGRDSAQPVPPPSDKARLNNARRTPAEDELPFENSTRTRRLVSERGGGAGMEWKPSGPEHELEKAETVGRALAGALCGSGYLNTVHHCQF